MRFLTTTDFASTVQLARTEHVPIDFELYLPES